MRDLSGRPLAQQRGEFGLQLRRRLEALVGLEVVLPWAVQCTGNMARDRIDRLLLAAVALRHAGIEQQAIALAECRHDVVGGDDIDQRFPFPEIARVGAAVEVSTDRPLRSTPASRRRGRQRGGARASAPATTVAQRTARPVRRTQRSECHCRCPRRGTARPVRSAPAADGDRCGPSWSLTGRRRSRQIARREYARRDRRAVLPRYRRGHGGHRRSPTGDQPDAASVSLRKPACV